MTEAVQGAGDGTQTTDQTQTTNAQAVATPVQGVVEQPQRTEPAAPSEPSVTGYTETGDHGVDLAGKFFAKSGIAEDSPEVQEALRGNWSYLEAKLASLGKKAEGWEQYLAIAKQGVERLQQAHNSTIEARSKVVFEAVGGEEEFNKISAWAKANGTPEELAEFKRGFAAGGVVAQATALFLQSQYLAASNTTQEPKSPVQQVANVTQQSGPMTRQQYAQEVAKLRAEVGDHKMDSDPRYHALRQRFANQ